MLSLTPGDAEPNVLLKRQQLDHLGDEPEEKFGPSEGERKQIWRELIAAEDRATKEAELAPIFTHVAARSTHPEGSRSTRPPANP